MPDSPKEEIRLKGVAASPGIAQAPAFIFLRREFDVPKYLLDPSAVDSELERFYGAMVETRRQIQEIRTDIANNLGEDEARIFDAHLLVLEDVALIEETQKELRETRFNIEYCFHKVAQRYIAFFDNIDDEYLRERVNDIRDVTRRMLFNLLGHTDYGISRMSRMVAGRILVTKDLSPSDAAGLEAGSLKGIATDSGGMTSHTVIMARSLNVPAVVGLHRASEVIQEGDTLLIDGYEGLVIVNPSDDTLYQYGEFNLRKKNYLEQLQKEAVLPSVTLDGKNIPLLVNIEGVRDLEHVTSLTIDGVGLFRTEGVFLRDNEIVSEEAQFDEYRRVVDSLQPRITTFRTFDLGGDKMLPNGLISPREKNPFMGLRAIRYCLRFPDAFRNQLRAVLRASHFGPTKMMYPMISGVGEIIEANRILDEVKASLDQEGIPYDRTMPIGSMIEIPSAAATIDLIGEHCSFVSIGTNDLIQYLLAVDRVNDMISDLYEPCHPAVLRTIAYIVEQAHKRGIKVSVCGEMAGDPIYAPLLIGLGVDELSVAPSLVPTIKYLIRHISSAEVSKLAQKALRMSHPGDTFHMLKQFKIGVFKSLIDA